MWLLNGGNFVTTTTRPRTVAEWKCTYAIVNFIWIFQSASFPNQYSLIVGYSFIHSGSKVFRPVCIKLRGMWQATHGLTGVVIYHTGNLIKFSETINNLVSLSFKMANKRVMLNFMYDKDFWTLDILQCNLWKLVSTTWINKYGILLKTLSNSITYVCKMLVPMGCKYHITNLGFCRENSQGSTVFEILQKLCFSYNHSIVKKVTNENVF